MIRAVFDGTHVTVCGHAGHAPAGQDIVCAAVSALVYLSLIHISEPTRRS